MTVHRDVKYDFKKIEKSDRKPGRKRRPLRLLMIFRKKNTMF